MPLTSCCSSSASVGALVAVGGAHAASPRDVKNCSGRAPPALVALVEGGAAVAEQEEEAAAAEEEEEAAAAVAAAAAARQPAVAAAVARVVRCGGAARCDGAAGGTGCLACWV